MLVTYDFEHDTVTVIDAPIDAFQQHLVAYDDGVEMGALKEDRRSNRDRRCPNTKNPPRPAKLGRP